VAPCCGSPPRTAASLPCIASLIALPRLSHLKILLHSLPAVCPVVISNQLRRQEKRKLAAETRSRISLAFTADRPQPTDKRNFYFLQLEISKLRVGSFRACNVACVCARSGQVSSRAPRGEPDDPVARSVLQKTSSAVDVNRPIDQTE
jgi:hypothetical protein